MKQHLNQTLVLALIFPSCVIPAAIAMGQADGSSRYATSDSRSDYVHRIELFDRTNTKVSPGANAQPYSPHRTCGRCHDYAHIATGFHFNPDRFVQDHGRAGEPWIWVDPTIGTQIPLSFREWASSYLPQKLGISDWKFVHKFGGRTPGGYPGAAEGNKVTAPEDEREPLNGSNRFHLSGQLEIDCMICHSRGSVFDLEAWSKQIEDQNFAWAPTVAIGLVSVDGQVRRLKDDFDIAASKLDGYRGRTLPTTTYDESRFDAEGKVFFDIVRQPSNNACYRCHSSLEVGPTASPRWNHDEDVHIRAGFQCIDCHRNDLGHNIVRGFENEIHPPGHSMANLSCRGCHMGAETNGSKIKGRGGRLGAPFPHHKGLPPIHLERLSCTTCHAGPAIGRNSELVQTALTHFLGHKDHRSPHQQPAIVQPVFMPDNQNVLYPHRLMWPSYFGTRNDGQITPLNPDETHDWLKSTLRVKRDFLEEMTRVRLNRDQKASVLGEERAGLGDEELTEEEKAKLADLEASEGLKLFQQKMHKALVKLQAMKQQNPVYVSGDKIFQLDENENLEVVSNPDPQPYSWPIAHDVRPARWALGANGCQDCHSSESPFFYSDVITQSTAPDALPTRRPMHEYAKLDANLLGTWNRTFQGRDAFKWTALISIASVAMILSMFGLFLLTGIFRQFRRPR